MGAERDDETFGELLSTVLLVPTPDEPSVAGTWELVALDVLSMLMAEDEDGLLTPAFRTVEALSTWRPEGGTYVERDASWLFGVAAADETGRVGVDLGSPTELVVRPDQVAALAQGMVPGAAGAPTQILVSTPVDPLPAEVMTAAHDAIAAEAAASSARLFLLDVGAERKQVIFVDLAPETTEAEVPEVMGRIVNAIAAGTDEAGDLRLMVVTPEWREAYSSGGLPVLER